MTVGPLELIVLGFDGNNFRGEIAPAIEAAEKSGAVRVVDLIFVRKDADGSIAAVEVEETDEAYARDFDTLKADIRGILTEEDTVSIAEMLPSNTSALVALLEHTWATEIATAVDRAGGRLLVSQRISPKTVNAISDELEALMAAPARAR
jgi:hypothetical protein